MPLQVLLGAADQTRRSGMRNSKTHGPRGFRQRRQFLQQAIEFLPDVTGRFGSRRFGNRFHPGIFFNTPSHSSGWHVNWFVFASSAFQIGRIMPKQKTHKGTKKRFRLTARGHAKHRQAGTSHLQSRMSNKRKRNLRGTTTVDKCMEKSIQAVLGDYSY